MKKFSSKSSGAVIILIIITSMTFILFEFLAAGLIKSNLISSENTILVLNVTKIISLLSGLSLLVWLISHKYNLPYSKRDTILYIISILLIEYWYFVVKLI